MKCFKKNNQTLYYLNNSFMKFNDYNDTYIYI